MIRKIDLINMILRQQYFSRYNMTTKNILTCQHAIIPACLDLNYSKCPHCFLDLCLEHIIEHQHLVRIDFNEVINQINDKKFTSDSHPSVDQMKMKALTALENWKAAQLESITNIYDTKRVHIEESCEQCMNEKRNVQNKIFDKLNTIINSLEKKKNIHPTDLLCLKQNLNDLDTIENTLETDTNIKITVFVSQIKLPEISQHEQQLIEAQQTIEHQKQELNEKNQELEDMEQQIELLHRQIRALQTKLSQLQPKIPQQMPRTQAWRQLSS